MNETYTLSGKEYRLNKKGKVLYGLCELVSAGIGGTFMAYLLVNAFFG